MTNPSLGVPLPPLALCALLAIYDHSDLLPTNLITLALLFAISSVLLSYWKAIATQQGAFILENAPSDLKEAPVNLKKLDLKLKKRAIQDPDLCEYPPQNPASHAQRRLLSASRYALPSNFPK